MHARPRLAVRRRVGGRVGLRRLRQRRRERRLAYPVRALPGKTTAHYPSFLPKKTLDPDIDATLIGHGGEAGAADRGPGHRGEDQGVPRRRHRQRADRPRRGPARSAGRDHLHLDRDDEGRQRRRAGLHRRLPLGRPSRFGVPHGAGPRRARAAAGPAPGPDAHLPAPLLRVGGRGHDAVGARPQARRRRTGTTRWRTTEAAPAPGPCPPDPGRRRAAQAMAWTTAR